MKNKLLALGEQSISELIEISNTLALDQSTSAKLAIGLLYKKIKTCEVNSLTDILTND